MKKSCTDAYACHKGYHGIMCGACDDTHGKAKSGSCMVCHPRWKHIAMATFLILWSAAIVAFVLRRALPSGGSDGIDDQNDKTTFSSSSPQSDKRTNLKSNIPRDSKQEHLRTKHTLSSMKNAQLSKSARDIVGSSKEVPSSLMQKSYISEIGKVSNRGCEDFQCMPFSL